MISDAFLTKLTEPRQTKRPEGFGSDLQSFRGVRSGVVRKIKCIVTRIQRGLPSNRVEREQDKRASRILLAAFGSIFHGHMGIHTMRHVMSSEDRFGKMLAVARNIWMRDAFNQLQAGDEVSLDLLIDKYIQTALHRINTSVGEGVVEQDDFVITSALIEAWLRTNQNILSPTQHKETPKTLVESLKTIVRNETYARVEMFGWDVIKRIRARCYKALDSGTVQSIFTVRGILNRLKTGESSIGKRGARKSFVKTPMGSELERHLLGLCRSTREFLSRQFDVQVMIAAQNGWL